MKNLRGRPQKSRKSKKPDKKSVKRAISRFLTRTQELVQSVKPNAQIIVPRKSLKSRKRQKPPPPKPGRRMQELLLNPIIENPSHIYTPKHQGTFLL